MLSPVAAALPGPGSPTPVHRAQHAHPPHCPADAAPPPAASSSRLGWSGGRQPAGRWARRPRRWPRAWLWQRCRPATACQQRSSRAGALLPCSGCCAACATGAQRRRSTLQSMCCACGCMSCCGRCRAWWVLPSSCSTSCALCRNNWAGISCVRSVADQCKLLLLLLLLLAAGAVRGGAPGAAAGSGGGSRGAPQAAAGASAGPGAW